MNTPLRILAFIISFGFHIIFGIKFFYLFSKYKLKYIYLWIERITKKYFVFFKIKSQNVTNLKNSNSKYFSANSDNFIL